MQVANIDGIWRCKVCRCGSIERPPRGICPHCRPRNAMDVHADNLQRWAHEWGDGEVVNWRGSHYLKVAGQHIRIADHPRQIHHAACYISEFGQPDITILVFGASQAKNYHQWRAESPREVLEADVIIIRKSRQHSRTLTCAIRSALAGVLMGKKRQHNGTRKKEQA